ncbi:MAG: glycosyltransferase family 2 protein [Candidatus Nezhaarchaeales archaeon]
MKVSFITFTKNSAGRISSLLDHIKDVVDEIIVVDGFSTDGTVEIAKRYGAKVYQRRPWGYVEPDRMFALKMCSHQWVLYLDDDERLCKKLKDEMKLLLETVGEEVSAFSITRVNLSHNKKPLLGPFYPDRQIRIFRKDRVTFKGLVHEFPIVHGRIYHLPEDYYILHIPSSKEFWPKKFTYYAYLEAMEYYRHKARSRLRRALWRLAPLSTSLIFVYLVVRSLILREPLNFPSLIFTFRLALYESLVNTLMNLRSKEESLRAKMIEERGLIRLLKLEE